MVSTELLIIFFGIAIGSIIGRITTKVLVALDFEKRKRKASNWRV